MGGAEPVRPWAARPEVGAQGWWCDERVGASIVGKEDASGGLATQGRNGSENDRRPGFLRGGVRSLDRMIWRGNPQAASSLGFEPEQRSSLIGPFLAQVPNNPRRGLRACRARLLCRLEKAPASRHTWGRLLQWHDWRRPKAAESVGRDPTGPAPRDGAEPTFLPGQHFSRGREHKP